MQTTSRVGDENLGLSSMSGSQQTLLSNTRSYASGSATDIRSLASNAAKSMASSAGTGSTTDSARIELEVFRETYQSGSWFRQQVFKLTEGNEFNNVILLVILANTALLYIETVPSIYRVYS
jgi:hypothetical protein